MKVNIKYTFISCFDHILCHFTLKLLDLPLPRPNEVDGYSAHAHNTRLWSVHSNSALVKSLSSVIIFSSQKLNFAITIKTIA